MSTGTLDLSEVDAERRRLERGSDRPDERDLTAEEHARRIVESVLASTQDEAARLSDGPSDTESSTSELDPDDPVAIARRIVEEVLAAEAVTDTAQQQVAEEQRPAGAVIADLDLEEALATGFTSSSAVTERRDLVMLSGDEPIALVPGPVYEAGTGPFVPPRDEIGALVERAMSTLQADAGTLTGTLREAAASEGMPGTRWILLGLLWMAAFAGLVPFAAATIGNALDLDIEILDETTDQAPAVEQQPEDASTDNPSVEGDAGQGADTP